MKQTMPAPDDTQPSTPPPSDPDDADLLRLFIARRDDRAFAALVARHGPMVLGVCRRVLARSEDADDAFQATFLVLAMRAASVTRPELLANWLFGVATRTAVAARRRGSRRRRLLRRFTDMLPHTAPHATAATGSLEDEELRSRLDEAIAALPERYRSVIVSCYLQGKTRREAARQLGWPEGTVATRLAQARQILHDRLLRQGVPSACLVAVPLEQCLAPVTVPPVISSAAVHAAGLLVTAGEAAASGAIAPHVLTLSKGVCTAMFTAKIKLAAAAVAASVVTVSLGIVAASIIRTPPSPSSTTPSQSSALTAAAPAAAPANKSDLAVTEGRARMVALTVLAYANDNAKRLPPDLGATLKHMEWGGPTARDKARSYLASADEQARQVPERPTPEWINKNASFTYLGAPDMVLSKSPDDNGGMETVIVYYREPAGEKRYVLGFIDGHSEVARALEAEPLIKRSKTALQSLRVPPAKK